MRHLGVPLLCAALSGCVMTPNNSQAPSVRNSPKDYQVVAACAYTALDRIYPTQIRLTSLPGANQARITSEFGVSGLIDSTNRVVDMTIEKTPSGSRIAILGASTVYGPEFYANRTFGEISACL